VRLMTTRSCKGLSFAIPKTPPICPAHQDLDLSYQED
jgi:hypothetical protein